MIWFLIGLMVGSFGGMLLMAIFASKRNEYIDKTFKDFDKEVIGHE